MNTKPYKRIYLQWEGHADEVTWCQDKINDSDLEYCRVVWRKNSQPPKDGKRYLARTVHGSYVALRYSKMAKEYVKDVDGLSYGYGIVSWCEIFDENGN